MYNPAATYRIQFNKDFTLKHLGQIIPYLHQLGISTLYASPIFEAVPGSTHGYDAVNPLRINPEIGTLEELEAVSLKLRELNISWLQDIVPNHMAFHQNNVWLMDVLENGKRSEYADFFDIIWSAPVYNSRVMVPFLGVPFEEALQEKQITIGFKAQGFVFVYGEQYYPLNLHAYITILESSSDILSINQLIEEAKELQQVDEDKAFGLRFAELKKQLASLYKQTASKKAIQACINKVNGDTDLLQQISNAQYYQLCFWQETEKQINFRRFFTVNGLICLNMQIPKVFDKCHELIKQLLNTNIIQGLRIDHIDGLYDPAGYLHSLRKLAGDETYIVVEKILEEGEKFPQSWPVQGSTGYDFLAIVNNLFTQAKNKPLFADFYRELTKEKQPITKAISKKKSLILFEHMAGELENLYQLFCDLELADKAIIEKQNIKAVIAEFLIGCPVYRFYGNSFPLPHNEQKAIKAIFKSISETKPKLQESADLLQNIFLSDSVAALQFYQRCMQFTGPLMAKGVEDTLMYTYDRFIGHNEVGDTPEAFGLPIADFHEAMAARQQQWPLAINATATHDTKRGEGARARLNVLTDMADEWLKAVANWQAINQKHKTNNAPDANDEYLFYQSIAGSLPMPGEGDDDFLNRMKEYLVKGLREAKLHTQWAEPNEDYEKSCGQFVKAILQPGSKFLQSFKALQLKIADYGIINSLAQVLLKFTCPGTPDVYQGCELWDLSMVDPDNRRPVDYDARAGSLTDIKKLTITQLWDTRYNANIKLWLTHLLFNERKTNTATFEKGSYLPLKVKGKYKDNVIAFARQNGDSWYIVALPLHLAQISEDSSNPGAINWGNTRLLLPADAPLQWKNLLTGNNAVFEKELPVSLVFEQLPFALFRSAIADNKRGAGILLHITSLPSAYGIGDIGPEAKNFVDLLHRTKQKYWQLLPFNPVDGDTFYSPYSSRSGMAGNILFISPEELVNGGFLDPKDLNEYKLIHNRQTDFKDATAIKKKLLNKAYQHFIQTAFLDKQEFATFCEQEAYWLNDFALYEVLKDEFKGKAWYQWPDEYRQKDKKVLTKFTLAKQEEIDSIKWQQWIFTRQWLALKRYANDNGIKLYGDIPFYVSHDSVDVWTNPELFKLNNDSTVKGIAGVPPDYFNADGQLWGMPVFNWDNLKATNYKWWINRVKRNMLYFDLLRLDHFRAFSEYWEVPAGETTAVNGTWQTGPGADLFNALKQALGSLPFIAEDLGEINPNVYRLRDEFNLPGMRVLQFAFGDDMPVSVHSLHNHVNNAVAYTGTHDNNTISGWFNQDSTSADRKRLNKITGSKVTIKTVHKTLVKLCYSSVANIAIIPIQDLLGLDESNRMNTPSSTDNNWTWRLPIDAITPKLEKWIIKQMKFYNRW